MSPITVTIPAGTGAPSSSFVSFNDLCVDDNITSPCCNLADYTVIFTASSGCAQTVIPSMGQYTALSELTGITESCTSGCGSILPANMYTTVVQVDNNHYSTPVVYDTTNTNLVTPGVVTGHALPQSGQSTTGNPIGYPGPSGNPANYLVLMNRCCEQSSVVINDGQYPKYQVPFYLSYTDHLGNDQNIHVHT